MSRKKVNLIILNYNGRELLPQFLPSVVESAKASRHDCRVTVLDNCSPDGSAAIVRDRFPGGRLELAAENKALCSYNDLAKKLDDDILIFLNNDIRTEKDFVDPLVEPFLGDPDVFFVATHEDRPYPERRWGVIGAVFSYPSYAEASQRGGYSFSAGIGAFDRAKFLELGGYDELYLPGRYEDVDLCYRGWKRGWTGVHAPGARKFHVGGASFNEKYRSGEIQAMVFRNGLLSMAKNITDPLWLAELAFYLPLQLLSAPVFGRWFVWRGFGQFLGRFPAALRGRHAAQKNTVRKDREILRLVREDLCGKP